MKDPIGWSTLCRTINLTSNRSYERDFSNNTKNIGVGTLEQTDLGQYYHGGNKTPASGKTTSNGVFGSDRGRHWYTTDITCMKKHAPLAGHDKTKTFTELIIL